MPPGPRPFELPPIRLEMLEDLSPDSGQGFLRLVRRRLRAHYPDGSSSAPFVYDEVDRRGIDAVVIAAHYAAPDGRRHVFLRSAIRPPVYFRGKERAPLPVPDREGGLWELPAGIVEVSEQSPDGVLRGAARELHEEAGFDVSPSRIVLLGPSMYPAPGVIAERHFFFEVEVDPRTRTEPHLDGSALEHEGRILDVSLAEAVDMCRTAEIEDGKTEIALRRLAERYS